MSIKIDKLCIEYTKNLLDAMELLNKNGQGIVFVTKNRTFFGTLTDGDIRRALISGADRQDSIEQYCNQQASTLHVNSPVSIIQNALSTRVKIIPLLDDQNNVVDFASIYHLRRFNVMEPLLRGQRTRIRHRSHKDQLDFLSRCVCWSF